MNSSIKLERWLQQVGEAETEKTIQLLDSCPAPKNGFKKWYLHFYPELNSLPSSNYTFSGPLWLHLLISSVVTVPIHPVRPEQFYDRYGMSINATLIHPVSKGLGGIYKLTKKSLVKLV